MEMYKIGIHNECPSLCIVYVMRHVSCNRHAQSPASTSTTPNSSQGSPSSSRAMLDMRPGRCGDKSGSASPLGGGA